MEYVFKPEQEICLNAKKNLRKKKYIPDYEFMRNMNILIKPSDILVEPQKIKTQNPARRNTSSKTKPIP